MNKEKFCTLCDSFMLKKYHINDELFDIYSNIESLIQKKLYKEKLIIVKRL